MNTQQANIVIEEYNSYFSRLFHNIFTHQETNLELIFDKVWDFLQFATESAKPNSHTPCFSSFNTLYPSTRTVVLRDVKKNHFLQFHTDKRSSKVTEIQNNPLACMHFYEHSLKLQIIAKGCCEFFINDSTAEHEWDKLAQYSKKCYSQNIHPNFEIQRVDDVQYQNELEFIENFCVVRLAVDSLECLYLKHTGNIKAKICFPDKKITLMAP